MTPTERVFRSIPYLSHNQMNNLSCNPTTIHDDALFDLSTTRTNQFDHNIQQIAHF